MPQQETAATRFTNLDALIAHLEAMARIPCEEAEGLSELDHGLQCAAELRIAAPDDVALQLAGLVHDVGHGLSPIADHAQAGEAALAPLLDPRIARLVGLHVAAKRYLVTTEPAYRALLSEDSIRSLALQGGDMSAEELAAFEAEPEAKGAVKLRRADEAAKVAGRRVDGLEAWLEALRRHARPAP
jgi:predicted HD phosphohydrolase